MIREERLDEAQARAGALVALIDALGTGVDAEDIRSAALVPLSPAAAQAVFNLGCLTLMHMDVMTAILAGCCSEERLAVFANVVWPMSKSAPKARPRRCSRRSRPTAADRRAAEWLSGPAWDRGSEPEPSPDRGPGD